MNEFIENFLQRPTYQKTLFWVGTLLILSFLYWQYSFSGQSEELTKLEEKVEDLTKKIADETRRAKNLDKMKAKVKELDLKLKFILQELPDRREIPDLLSSISDLARNAGLEVSLFRPGAENMKDFYAEVPVAISVDGTYHQVATFFDEVGQLSRIVNITQIVVRDAQITDAAVKVKTDCVATTFRYLDENERNAAAGKTDPGNKRRR